MKALEIDSVSKSYGELKALDEVSFHINEGEMFSLLGPNGSGKTTLISIISSLLKSDGGHIKVFGQEVGPDRHDTKRLFGLVPQEIINHGFFTVEEILEFVSGYYGIYKNKERINFLLKKLGLDEHRKKLVNQLSGGMKRRFLIAKALIHRPKLLLLDEPTAGVDIELRNSLWEFVRELNEKEGMAILLTTHYLEEAEELCDRISIISHGKLLKTGKTKDLISDLTQRIVELKLTEEVQCASEFLTRQEGKKLFFEVPKKHSVGDILKSLELDRSLIEDIKIKEGNLEDAFLNVVQGARNAE